MHNSTNYPPYNLVEVSEDTYMIELALAGFKKEDIAIEQEKNVLTIKGSSAEDSNKYIHKGIGARAILACSEAVACATREFGYRRTLCSMVCQVCPTPV